MALTPYQAEPLHVTQRGVENDPALTASSWRGVATDSHAISV
jgi:hypothetical protein